MPIVASMKRPINMESITQQQYTLEFKRGENCTTQSGQEISYQRNFHQRNFYRNFYQGNFYYRVNVAPAEWRQRTKLEQALEWWTGAPNCHNGSSWSQLPFVLSHILIFSTIVNHALFQQNSKILILKGLAVLKSILPC